MGFARYPFAILSVAVLTLLGCTSGDDSARAALLDESVASKLASWQMRRDRACRIQALGQAELLADSLILDYAREQKLMLARPGRPLRPEEPPLRRPSDTLQLAPFLDSL